MDRQNTLQQAVSRMTVQRRQDSVEAAIGFSGELADCDCCGRPMQGERFFADARLDAHGGAWGIVCWTCTQTEGIQPGWGRAQFYEHSAAFQGPASSVGRWHCVAGHPPARAIGTDIRLAIEGANG